MLKISRLADYGIVLLTFMAKEPRDEVFTARDLANTTCLPLPMVSKVLKLLARGNLLDSHRGVKGGYSLSRCSELISLADIISALDGPIALTTCLESSENCCGIETNCYTKSYWTVVNNRVVKALQTLSLAEMVAPDGTIVPLAGNGRKNNLKDIDGETATVASSEK